ncbi:MAG: amidohydrolase family protein [Chloroflexi bacterium]|nr:amidohydrolase family protein [Chloroflexota bacterium]
MIDLLLRDVVTAVAPEPVCVAVHDGRILAIGPTLNYVAKQEVAGNGRYLIPGFVESHLHLDIALSNDPHKPGRTVPYASMSELNAAIERRRRAFTHEEIVERATAALRLGLRHGTTAVRAQCHLDTEIGLKHIVALQAVKEAVADWLTLQIVAFPQQGLLRDPRTLDLFREAFRCGADVMGGAANIETGFTMQEHIDAAFALAMKLDRDLDIHADLSLKPDVTLDDLEVVHIARRTLDYGYQGRVTVGHACTLDSASPEVAAQAIALLQEADITVTSQPDLYRLGREDRQHVRRGLTRVKELLAAGVNVTYASNNVRDALRPLGNLNLLEEALILAYGAHMDTVVELETLLRMSTTNAARALRLPDYGLEPGCIADMVLLDAPSASAAIVGQAEKCYVFKAGKLRAMNKRQSQLTMNN